MVDTRESLKRKIPSLPTDIWDNIREKTRGQFEAIQKSDVDDDFGRAVKSRNNYTKQSSAQKNISISLTINAEQATIFIQSALLFLFDNTHSVHFQTPPRQEDSKEEFSRASLQSQMIELVKKPYIDELLLYVPSLSKDDADHITKVYYNYNNETVGNFSAKFIEEMSTQRTKIGTQGRKRRRGTWVGVRSVLYIGFDRTEPRDKLVVALINNTFYWLTADNIANDNVSQKRIEKNDLTFPIENFVFESIVCTTDSVGDYFEVERGDNIVPLKLEY